MDLNEEERQSLEDVLTRARQAIERAKSLSAHFSSAGIAQEAQAEQHEGQEPAAGSQEGSHEVLHGNTPCTHVPMQTAWRQQGEETANTSSAGSAQAGSPITASCQIEGRQFHHHSDHAHGEGTECSDGTRQAAQETLEESASGSSRQDAEEAPTIAARPLLDVARRWVWFALCMCSPW